MNRLTTRWLPGALLLMALAGGLVPGHPETSAQESATTPILTIPLTDPGDPVHLDVRVLHGSITIESGSSDEVEVEVVRKGKMPARDSAGGDGMRRIPNVGGGVNAQEIDNRVVVQAKGTRPVHLRIRTPRQTSAKVTLTNGGAVEVSGLTGDQELKNVNGGISATDISGSVVANTTNGPVVVTFRRMDRDKPMSFQSWNGRVDVSLPADLDADLRLETSHGEIYSDFDVAVSTEPAERGGDRDRKGRYSIELSGEIRGQVGDGGPQMRFKTYNGDIYVRKAR